MTASMGEPTEMELSEVSDLDSMDEVMDATVSDVRASFVQENSKLKFLDDNIRQRYLAELGDLYAEIDQGQQVSSK